MWTPRTGEGDSKREGDVRETAGISSTRARSPSDGRDDARLRRHAYVVWMASRVPVPMIARRAGIGDDARPLNPISAL